MAISKEFSIDDINSIAKKAGDSILEIYNLGSDAANVEYKDDKSPLTAADLASNSVITNFLSKLTPDIPILSEEGAKIRYEDRSSWETFWLIDPLDGTKEFVKRNGEFTVNIALIEDSKPVLGTVYAPVLDILWYGDEDGSFKQINNKTVDKITVSPNTSHDSVRVVVSRSHLSPDIETFLGQFNSYELMRMGSSIKMCLVADGSADIYPRLGPTMEWDSAASHAIVNNAGGSIKNIETGKDLVYNKEDLHNPWFIVNSGIEYRV